MQVIPTDYWIQHGMELGVGTNTGKLQQIRKRIHRQT